jgi:hypothetical protein
MGADDPIEEPIKTMQAYKVRRLPVIDRHEPVRRPNQADVARNYPEDRRREFVLIVSYPEPTPLLPRRLRRCSGAETFLIGGAPAAKPTEELTTGEMIVGAHR